VLQPSLTHSAFLRVCAVARGWRGCHVLVCAHAQGLTETCGIVSAKGFEPAHLVGSTGAPVTTVRVKLVSCPDLNDASGGLRPRALCFQQQSLRNVPCLTLRAHGEHTGGPSLVNQHPHAFHTRAPPLPSRPLRTAGRPYLAEDVVDEQGARCFGRGEVVVAGTNLSARYFKQPALTAEVFGGGAEVRPPRGHTTHPSCSALRLRGPLPALLVRCCDAHGRGCGAGP